MAEKVNLDPFVRGDTWTNKFTFTDAAGAAIDVTGWQLWVTLKLDPTVADVDADMQSTVTLPVGADATGGIGYVVSTAAETDVLTPATHFYDFQYKQPSGEIQTIASGQVTVDRDITRAT
jgi:hypothetical protein